MNSHTQKEIEDILLRDIHGGNCSVPKWDNIQKAARSIMQKLSPEGNPSAPTSPAGAEGEGEILDDYKRAWFQASLRISELINEIVTASEEADILQDRLSAAQAKIAELQARVNELQEWHDSHL